VKIKLSPKMRLFIRRFLDEGQSQYISDKALERSYALSKLLRHKKGNVLEVGCSAADNQLPIVLAWLGWDVYGLDIRGFDLNHPNFHFISEDIRQTSFHDDFFDYVTAVSTIEHIGLVRYGTTEEDPEGDVKAVREIKRILKPKGTFILTIPYGREAVIKPLHRVYGKHRLNLLLEGWEVLDSQYYAPTEQGQWKLAPEHSAAEVDASKGNYAIALFELRPGK